MKTSGLTEGIKRLPSAQPRAIPSLTGDELAALAQRFAESDDPAEVERLRTAIVRGVYGEEANA